MYARISHGITRTLIKNTMKSKYIPRIAKLQKNFDKSMEPIKINRSKSRRNMRIEPNKTDIPLLHKVVMLLYSVSVYTNISYIALQQKPRSRTIWNPKYTQKLLKLTKGLQQIYNTHQTEAKKVKAKCENWDGSLTLGWNNHRKAT